MNIKYTHRKGVLILISALTIYYGGIGLKTKYNPVYKIDRVLSNYEVSEISSQFENQIEEFNSSGIKYGLPLITYKNNSKIKSKLHNKNYMRVYNKFNNDMRQIVEIEGTNSFKSKATVKVLVMFYKPNNYSDSFEGELIFLMEKRFLQWKIVDIVNHNLIKVES